jgi:uncharacterized protein (DUF433 family)
MDVQEQLRVTALRDARIQRGCGRRFVLWSRAVRDGGGSNAQPLTSWLGNLVLSTRLRAAVYTPTVQKSCTTTPGTRATPQRENSRELVVVRNDQRVFTEVVELYLRRIDFAADGYAQLIRLPQYRASEVTVDPDHEFGRPRFVHGGSAVDNVIDLFRAGEPVDAVAEEFGLSRDEVEDAIRVATRAAA